MPLWPCPSPAHANYHRAHRHHHKRPARARLSPSLAISSPPQSISLFHREPRSQSHKAPTPPARPPRHLRHSGTPYAGFFTGSGPKPSPTTPLHHQLVSLRFAMDGTPPRLPRPSPALNLGRRSPQLPATVVLTAPPPACVAVPPWVSSASINRPGELPIPG